MRPRLILALSLPTAVLLAVAIALVQQRREAVSRRGVEPDAIQADGIAGEFLRVAFTGDTPGTALDRIEAGWKPGWAPMALETVGAIGGGPAADRLIRLLIAQADRDLGHDINDWYAWLWNQQITPPPGYADFKAELYGRIDPRFRGYFSADRTANIRLDEVRWGGVRQDGIPPLRSPDMVPASAAVDLDDDNVIFGISVNGDTRAYPQRILAWHEMFTDVVGGEPVGGIYCTLCGSMILYRTHHRGIDHQLGTSALSAEFLNRHAVHHDQIGDLGFVVLTDPSGANRVYEDQGLRFISWDGDHTVTDERQRSWTLTEDRLIRDDQERARLPAHRAFWFGWYAAYPQTRLVK